MKLGPKGPIENNTALVEKMAWRQIGDKQLSEATLIHWRVYARLEDNTRIFRPVSPTAFYNDIDGYSHLL